MGNFIGEYETSVLPTMTMFEANQYPLIRTINKKSIKLTVKSIKNKLFQTLTKPPIQGYFKCF